MTVNGDYADINELTVFYKNIAVLVTTQWNATKQLLIVAYYGPNSYKLLWNNTNITTKPPSHANSINNKKTTK